MKLVADVDIPYFKGALDDFFDQIIYLKGSQISHSDIVDADVLVIRTRTLCNSDLLSGTKVKFIATATIGTDHIDMEYCEKQNIRVVNAAGCNANAVVQWVLSAMFSILGDQTVNLKGQTLGVVGVGNIGSRLAGVARALGANVLLCDPPRAMAGGDENFVHLQQIARESSIISFHVPLTHHGNDATFHMANSKFFRDLNPKSIVINSSRGGVVDELALIDAIKTKGIRAALDVWENEPLINSNLLHKVQVATPHIAGYSAEGKVNATSMVIDQLAIFMNLSTSNRMLIPDKMKQKVEVDMANCHKNNKINYRSLILKIYDVRTDDEMFRNDPLGFEMYRNNYAYRRDFDAFIMKGLSGNKDIETLKALGISTQ